MIPSYTDGDCSVTASSLLTMAGSGEGKCGADVDECASGPCKSMQNGVMATSGTCTDSTDDVNIPIWSYRCACSPGWEGANCEIDYDECGSSPCLHDAVCSESSSDNTLPFDAFRCQCLAGWANGFCTPALDEATNTNLADWIWAETGQSYACAVTGVDSTALNWPRPDGTSFPGICDVDIDECLSNPCQSSGVCKDSTTSTEIAADHYLCECPKGRSGWDCEIDFDECSSSPCRNAGVCTHSGACITAV